MSHMTHIQPDVLSHDLYCIMQVPSILSEELTYNPFLFTESPDLKDALGMTTDSTPAQVLAEVRKQKNIYDRTFI